MTWATPIERATAALAMLAMLTGSEGCGASAMGALRFENLDAIRTLDDRTPVPAPKKYELGPIADNAGALIAAKPMYALSAPGPQPARDVNALDEVPDSSWFENRIGVREIRASELALGPGSGGPDRSTPLRILASKVGGTVPGLLVEDATGARYLLKFDPVWPETETNADVVAQRLLWAAGYHVPDDNVLDLERSHLVLAPDAILKDELGEERPYTVADLEAMLADRVRRADGRFRVLASKFLPGKPIGGYVPQGVRPDDPNDRIPHEHRRSLRAQVVFFAWLCHTDVKIANTLDTWIEAPPGSGRGYVVHYILDFGKALGVWGRNGGHESDGFAAQFDYGIAFRSLISLGLWRRPWEGVSAPDLQGIGRYEAEHFDAGQYSPSKPYVPFLYAERQDAFWAARIIARFRPEHIAAAVDAARYSDPRAREYLLQTILARQRKTLEYWFSQVAPLDGFTVHADGGSLQVCGVDLALQHGLGSPAATRYRARSYDEDGDAIGRARNAPSTVGGTFCVPGLELSRSRDAYTMVALETWRGSERLPDVVLHAARPPDGGPPRVIGIERR